MSLKHHKCKEKSGFGIGKIISKKNRRKIFIGIFRGQKKDDLTIFVHTNFGNSNFKYESNII